MAATEKLQWLFEALGDFGGSTGQAWKDVLSGSEQSSEALLAREAIQNSSDAHDKSKPNVPVHVRISRLILKGSEHSGLAGALLNGSELRNRIDAIGIEKLGLPGDNIFSKLLAPTDQTVEITVVEDFNTIGLGGALPNEHGEAKETDHFQKLLFMLGGTDKKDEASSGGSFGYGKSVYSALSDGRLVAYYSVFDPDERSDGHHARFIVSGLFDSHPHGGKNNTGRAYLAIPNERGGPTPANDEDAHQYAELLGLRRRNPNERGTTIVIFGTRLNMDALRSEIEKYWWPKLVDQELTIELRDSSSVLPPPAPKANEALKPFLACYEMLARRQEPDAQQGQKRARLTPYSGLSLGEWAATRVNRAPEEAEDADDPLLNKIALVRGSKMVIEYSDRLCLPGATVPIVGVFVANGDVDTILKLSEPPAHHKWDPMSLRLEERSHAIVHAILDRLRRQIRKFHRELLPTPPPNKSRLKLLEEMLGKLLEGEPGIDHPEPTSDPFTITHRLARKARNRQVYIAGSVKIEIREDAEERKLNFEYTPRVEILEDERRASGDELSLIELKVKDGSGRIETKNNRRTITGTLRKGVPLVVSLQSELTNPDWLLAYREELRATIPE